MSLLFKKFPELFMFSDIWNSTNCFLFSNIWNSENITLQYSSQLFPSKTNPKSNSMNSGHPVSNYKFISSKRCRILGEYNHLIRSNCARLYLVHTNLGLFFVFWFAVYMQRVFGIFNAVDCFSGNAKKLFCVWVVSDKNVSS